MSKKDTAVHPIVERALGAIPAIQGDGLLTDSVAASGRLLAHLDAMRAFVPYVLMHGILVEQDNDFATIAEMAALSQLGGQQDLDALNAVRTTGDADPTADGMSLLHKGAIAGYLLGLAVGQALGPDALKGGAQ